MAPADRGNLRIYPLLPPAVRKRRTNEAAPVCPWAVELITVSSNGLDEAMSYYCWRYIALVLICRKTTKSESPFAFQTAGSARALIRDYEVPTEGLHHVGR